jgi:hypothetical protein
MEQPSLQYDGVKYFFQNDVWDCFCRINGGMRSGSYLTETALVFNFCRLDLQKSKEDTKDMYMVFV